MEKENENAYERIKPTCNSLVEILQGKTGGEDIALPGIEKRVGFYNCVLKKQSREMLSSDLRDYIDDVIQSSFLLGLISHLYLYDNPSRSEFENVDAPAVMKQLAPRMMNSSGKMRKYNRKLNTIPILIFEHYFDNQITPLLNEQLNLGLLDVSLHEITSLTCFSAVASVKCSITKRGCKQPSIQFLFLKKE